MFDRNERDIIRGYLGSGMTPDAPVSIARTLIASQATAMMVSECRYMGGVLFSFQMGSRASGPAFTGALAPALVLDRRTCFHRAARGTCCLPTM